MTQEEGLEGEKRILTHLSHEEWGFGDRSGLKIHLRMGKQ